MFIWGWTTAGLDRTETSVYRKGSRKGFSGCIERNALIWGEATVQSVVGKLWKVLCTEPECLNLLPKDLGSGEKNWGETSPNMHLRIYMCKKWAHEVKSMRWSPRGKVQEVKSRRWSPWGEDRLKILSAAQYISLSKYSIISPNNYCLAIINNEINTENRRMLWRAVRWEIVGQFKVVR